MRRFPPRLKLERAPRTSACFAVLPQPLIVFAQLEERLYALALIVLLLRQLPHLKLGAPWQRESVQEAVDIQRHGLFETLTALRAKRSVPFVIAATGRHKRLKLSHVEPVVA